jgi:hypothetical protein
MPYSPRNIAGRVPSRGGSPCGLLSLGLALFSAVAAAAATLDTAFSYQGRLTDGGMGPTGAYDFRFILYDAEIGGNQVGNTLTNENVTATEGLFFTTVDAGATVFDGSLRWLEVAVRPGTETGPFLPLNPRQPLLPVPQSLYSVSAGAADFAATATTASNVTAGAVSEISILNNAITDAKLADGAVTTPKLADRAVTGPKLADGAVGSAKLAPSLQVGTPTNSGILQVFNSLSDTVGIELDGLGRRVVAYGTDNLERARLSGASFGMVQLHDADNDPTVDLTATTSFGGQLSLRNGSGATRAFLDGGGLHDGGELQLRSSNGVTMRLFGNAPREFFPDQATDAAGMDLSNEDGERTILVRAQEPMLGMYNDGNQTVELRSSNTGATLNLSDAVGDDDNEVILVAGEASGARLQLIRNGALAINLVTQNEARIGIGRFPDSRALEVEGNAAKSAAGDWLANSDARIKIDVRPLTNALEVISRVRPVGFHYTEEYRKAHPAIQDVEHYNVIAQEFAEVFPDSVSEGGDTLPNGEKILQVDTYPATIHAIAAIQELHLLVETKDAKIKELERRLETLERRFKGRPIKSE